MSGVLQTAYQQIRWIISVDWLWLSNKGLSLTGWFACCVVSCSVHVLLMRIQILLYDLWFTVMVYALVRSRGAAAPSCSIALPYLPPHQPKYIEVLYILVNFLVFVLPCTGTCPPPCTRWWNFSRSAHAYGLRFTWRRGTISMKSYCCTSQSS